MTPSPRPRVIPLPLAAALVAALLPWQRAEATVGGPDGFG